ncbi:MAG: YicC family protein [Rhodospirillales bacterium 70-18]|nr:YicC family protein [Rhodospirillales bacterium]OJY66747.1 MAG: YicC family protein [Rhodospirillales bacterium 70-18]
MTLALASMTGFARTEGVVDGLAWAWELRSVNGRGLELRFRLPTGFDTLEPALREAAGRLLKRGNVTANLTVRRDEQPKLAPDPAALEQVLALATALAARIPGAPAPRAEALLALPGVLRAAAAGNEEVGPAALAAARAGFDTALSAMATARRGEGARLDATLRTLLAEIAALHLRAAEQAADQPAAQRVRMLETVRALMAELPALPEERIAQEVALLAAKSDVREELDRLDAHLHAAHALLAEAVAIGRRFDFLVQEFNREANTLCSKSASVALTATGLTLKATIEQLREQVQNIE